MFLQTRPACCGGSRRRPGSSRPGWSGPGVALETGWEFRRWADGSVLFAQQLGTACVGRYGEHTWTMHRADLLQVLRSALPPEAIEAGRRCTGAAQDAGGVTLTFSSGPPVRAEVLIAATPTTPSRPPPLACDNQIINKGSGGDGHG